MIWKPQSNSKFCCSCGSVARHLCSYLTIIPKKEDLTGFFVAIQEKVSPFSRIFLLVVHVGHLPGSSWLISRLWQSGLFSSYRTNHCELQSKSWWLIVEEPPSAGWFVYLFICLFSGKVLGGFLHSLPKTIYKWRNIGSWISMTRPRSQNWSVALLIFEPRLVVFPALCLPSCFVVCLILQWLFTETFIDLCFWFLIAKDCQQSLKISQS